jgi:hypothetical protein
MIQIYDAIVLMFAFGMFELALLTFIFKFIKNEKPTPRD